MRVTKKSRRLKALIGATTATVAALPVFVGVGVASAETPGQSDATKIEAAAKNNGGTHLVSAKAGSGNKMSLRVYSASMGREIPLEVIRPADTSKPAPTLYLLNGAGGGEDSASWQKQADIGTFFQGKQVNVVTPMQGAFTYYTDWQKPDESLHGVNKWETFLTQELPPVLDSALGTTGVNTLAGISTSGTSVFNLALKKPDLYKAVGAYSGCADTATPVGQTYIQIVIAARGSADVENMWGPVGSPDWIAHDPILNIGKLKDGPKLYVSNASGLPGPHDTLDSQGINGDVKTLANQVVVGGIIEAATNECTHRLFDAVNRNGMGGQATFDFKPAGTHSWGYWKDDLNNSWPMLADAMNTPR
ncbi:diacylglycerol O-acyltransferase/trehalose O-mycolyltransferase [Rhodococcus sp. LBL1]|nr:diacylglycerol O-acyltransferase/trehalose O-mycolyltransferase [Rhodococcus sp. LBL1]MDH6681762.1 diacylglycerol O-acyltransferase/trehalose O-mycolyltransferase [Rhodococcus sp. LBL2]